MEKISANRLTRFSVKPHAHDANSVAASVSDDGDADDRRLAPAERQEHQRHDRQRGEHQLGDQQLRLVVGGAPVVAGDRRSRRRRGSPCSQARPAAARRAARRRPRSRRPSWSPAASPPGTPARRRRHDRRRRPCPACTTRSAPPAAGRRRCARRRRGRRAGRRGRRRRGRGRPAPIRGSRRRRRGSSRCRARGRPAGSEALAACSTRRTAATSRPCAPSRAGSRRTSTMRPGPPMVVTSRVPGTRFSSASTAWATRSRSNAPRAGSLEYSVSGDDRHVVDALGLDQRLADAELGRQPVAVRQDRVVQPHDGVVARHADLVLDRDQRLARLRHRPDVLEALDLRQHLLRGHGDQPLDVRGRRARETAPARWPSSRRSAALPRAG